MVAQIESKILPSKFVTAFIARDQIVRDGVHYHANLETDSAIRFFQISHLVTLGTIAMSHLPQILLLVHNQSAPKPLQNLEHSRLNEQRFGRCKISLIIILRHLDLCVLISLLLSSRLVKYVQSSTTLD